MEENSRPLDMLNNSRNKRVMIDLKNGFQYIGKLKAFDIHINMVLEEVEEHRPEEVEKEVNGKLMRVRTGNLVLKRKMGVVFIRGDTITTISPA
jgi:small nuclear ribonucleoprotein